jgi:hypothetical protein
MFSLGKGNLKWFYCCLKACMVKRVSGYHGDGRPGSQTESLAKDIDI